MNDALWLLALVGLGGAAGAFFIARQTRGAATAIGCIGWFVLPFVVLAFLLNLETDATLPAQRQSDNFAFGFILISLFIVVPWGIATLIGGVLGLVTRKAKPAPEPAFFDQGTATPAERSEGQP